MLFIRHQDLEAHARVSGQMFRDRAAQFKDRLGWDLEVTPDGLEVDQYDKTPAVYAIALDAYGDHAGSVRFKPTTGPTMINEHFSHLLGEPWAIHSKKICEVTRFCLSPNAPKETAAALMLATNAWGAALDLEGMVAVFDAQMRVIYKRLGHSPELLMPNTAGPIAAGIWRRDPAAVAALERRSGLDFETLLTAAKATSKGKPHHGRQV